MAKKKKLTEKWGFIDMSGTLVIEPRFDNVESFSEGMALVKIGPEYGPGKYG